MARLTITRVPRVAKPPRIKKTRAIKPVKPVHPVRAVKLPGITVGHSSHRSPRAGAHVHHHSPQPRHQGAGHHPTRVAPHHAPKHTPKHAVKHKHH
jgi:hypothetical protein